MLDAFEQRNFADRSGWDPVVFLFQSDLFERHEFSSNHIFAFVDYSIGSFAKLFKSLVALELFCVVAKLLLRLGYLLVVLMHVLHVLFVVLVLHD